MWNFVLIIHCAAKDINYFEESSLQGSDAVSGGRVFLGTGLLGLRSFDPAVTTCTVT